jgi:hypothetical protein
VGFLIGTAAGILLAIGIVHNRAMDMSVMPWAVISQTVPIVALAPMIIVVLNSVGVQGLLPKAIISAYLSFFPVVVGMVKGLRTPDAMQLDLMRTWNAGTGARLWKLRLPSSVPYLFASLKIAVAASLVGTIVGELPVQRGGPRRADAGGELLRPDGADLGRAGDGGAAGGPPRLAHGVAGAAHAARHGGAGMTLVVLALVVWAGAWAFNAWLTRGPAPGRAGSAWPCR